MAAAVEIERAGAERIEELEPLHLALAEHHGRIRPSLAGLEARDGASGWANRRPHYEEWLAAPGAFVLIARRGGAAVGFALVTVEPGFDGWGEGGAIGELHDLAVLPAERGGGIGTRLLDRVAAELDAAGVEHLRLLVLAGNDDAARLYERWGMEPVVTTMLGRTRR
jgi:ribosomal protein S18 acetylase RimI-like enzyme